MKPFETELTMEAESPRVYRLVLTGGAFSFGRHFPLFLRPLRRCYGKSRGFLSHFIFRQASHPLCVFVSLSFPLAFRVKIIFFSSSDVEHSLPCAFCHIRGDCSTLAGRGVELLRWHRREPQTEVVSHFDQIIFPSRVMKMKAEFCFRLIRAVTPGGGSIPSCR